MDWSLLAGLTLTTRLTVGVINVRKSVDWCGWPAVALIIIFAATVVPFQVVEEDVASEGFACCSLDVSPPDLGQVLWVPLRATRFQIGKYGTAPRYATEASRLSGVIWK